MSDAKDLPSEMERWQKAMRDVDRKIRQRDAKNEAARRKADRERRRRHSTTKGGAR